MDNHFKHSQKATVPLPIFLHTNPSHDVHAGTKYHLVMTNIAMENPYKWRFLAGKIIYKWAIFHGYVK